MKFLKQLSAVPSARGMTLGGWDLPKIVVCHDTEDMMQSLARAYKEEQKAKDFKGQQGSLNKVEPKKP